LSSIVTNQVWLVLAKANAYASQKALQFVCRFVHPNKKPPLGSPRKPFVSEPLTPTGPFAPRQGSNVTISLWMLLFSMVVFAGISLAIALASRVPLISNGINDIFGLPQTAKSDKPDRTTHLLFLLFCYSSPLLFAMWISILHGLASRWQRYRQSASVEDDSTNPFS
jgi:hypothetical protein